MNTRDTAYLGQKSPISSLENARKKLRALVVQKNTPLIAATTTEILASIMKPPSPKLDLEQWQHGPLSKMEEIDLIEQRLQKFREMDIPPKPSEAVLPDTTPAMSKEQVTDLIHKAKQYSSMGIETINSVDKKRLHDPQKMVKIIPIAEDNPSAQRHDPAKNQVEVLTHQEDRYSSMDNNITNTVNIKRLQDSKKTVEIVPIDKNNPRARRHESDTQVEVLTHQENRHSSMGNNMKNTIDRKKLQVHIKKKEFFPISKVNPLARRRDEANNQEEVLTHQEKQCSSITNNVTNTEDRKRFQNSKKMFAIVPIVKDNEGSRRHDTAQNPGYLPCRSASRDRSSNPQIRLGSRERSRSPRNEAGCRDRTRSTRSKAGSRDRSVQPRIRSGSRERSKSPRKEAGSRDGTRSLKIKAGSCEKSRSPLSREMKVSFSVPDEKKKILGVDGELSKSLSAISGIRYSEETNSAGIKIFYIQGDLNSYYRAKDVIRSMVGDGLTFNKCEQFPQGAEADFSDKQSFFRCKAGSREKSRSPRSKADTRDRSDHSRIRPCSRERNRPPRNKAGSRDRMRSSRSRSPLSKEIKISFSVPDEKQNILGVDGGLTKTLSAISGINYSEKTNSAGVKIYSIQGDPDSCYRAKDIIKSIVGDGVCFKSIEHFPQKDFRDRHRSSRSKAGSKERSKSPRSKADSKDRRGYPRIRPGSRERSRPPRHEAGSRDRMRSSRSRSPLSREIKVSFTVPDEKQNILGVDGGLTKKLTAISGISYFEETNSAGIKIYSIKGDRNSYLKAKVVLRSMVGDGLLFYEYRSPTLQGMEQKMISNSYEVNYTHVQPQSHMFNEFRDFLIIPDKFISAIIGDSFEQISQLQSQYGCMIRMTPDKRSKSDTICTITGNQEAVSVVKDVLNRIMQDEFFKSIGNLSNSNKKLDVPANHKMESIEEFPIDTGESVQGVSKDHLSESTKEVTINERHSMDHRIDTPEMQSRVLKKSTFSFRPSYKAASEIYQLSKWDLDSDSE